LNTYAYLDSLPSTFADPETLKSHDPDNSLLDENSYQAHRTLLVRNESHILRVLGFETHVALPHALCITYLQTLDVFGHPQSSVLSQRAVVHLNTALLSPQLVYLTHQPNALATAAIYLAAREVGVKLPGEEWWEVFDTDREELGFLVVAMLSVEGFVAEEKARWGKRKIPLTVDDLEAELESRSILDQNVTGI
jgi:cyclin L